MATWFFEPGHTAAMFRARHMMVTYVRGHFKNVSGSLVFDPENPAQSSADVVIDAAAIWTGQPQRDAHLRSADFLDVENHPRITFKGNQVEVAGARDYIQEHWETRRSWQAMAGPDAYAGLMLLRKVISFRNEWPFGRS